MVSAWHQPQTAPPGSHQQLEPTDSRAQCSEPQIRGLAASTCLVRAPRAEAAGMLGEGGSHCPSAHAVLVFTSAEGSGDAT